jgi:hypothetical protein
MKTYLALPIGLLIAFSFARCTNTVTEVQYVYVPTGPALARFISMMPDNSAIILRDTPYVSAPIFYSTLTATQPSYLPLTPDSAERYYLYSAIDRRYLDAVSISAPQLKDASVNTFALFWIDTQGTTPARAICVGGGNNDSNKYRPIPKGFARLRFINGVANYPTQPNVSLDLDRIDSSIDTRRFSEMSDYILIPAGTHKLIVSTVDTRQPIDSTTQVFVGGLFYTARFIGIHGNPDPSWADRLIVDPE